MTAVFAWLFAALICELDAAIYAYVQQARGEKVQSPVIALLGATWCLGMALATATGVFG